MIGWLNPLALVALAAVVAPVVVHLLLRHRARRVVVPTVRFVSRAAPQAVHLRRPSDLFLLMLRVAIVAVAALAVAAPLFLTERRLARWNERVAKAVIIDVADGASTADIEPLRAERLGSDPYRQIETRDLAPALRRAALWLQLSPPARREIVVFSPFVAGSLADSDLADLPQELGLRFVRTTRRPPRPLMGQVVTPEGRRQFEAVLLGEGISVRYGETRPLSFDGLEIRGNAPNAAAINRLLRVIARANVAAPQSDIRTVIQFSPGASFAAKSPPQPHVTAAALRLVQDPSIHDVPMEVSVSGDELRVSADINPDALEAAAVVRAALEAGVDRHRFRDHEVTLIPDTLLRAWSREPATVSLEGWQASDRSDARWFWLVALLLLGVETMVRRSAGRPVEKVTVDAA